jgi:hypothetical protein
MKLISKKTSAVCLITFILLSSCTREKPVILRFQNPIPIERINEVITLSYSEFSNQAGDLPDGMLPLFIDGKDTLISQNIDLDKDNKPEEILIEISLNSMSKKDIKIAYVPIALFPRFKLKTNLHFAYLKNPQEEIDSAGRYQTSDTKITASAFQMEGPAWENDKAGFRNYFDLRNGMDIFGKIPGFMAMDTIGLGKHSYHIMSSWGMDILKVGNSLGAGGIGLEKDGKLYRIGDNGKSGFERVYEGPLKTEFALHFKDWKAGRDSFNVIQYISVTAGNYRYESEVFTDFPDQSYSLLTGIVNKHADSLIFEDAGKNHILMATHSIQSEDTAALGMGLLMPRSLYQSHSEAPKTGGGITETYYIRTSGSMDDPAKFYFYAGWATGNPIFKDKEKFINLIKEDALKLENPIQFYKVIN